MSLHLFQPLIDVPGSGGKGSPIACGRRLLRRRRLQRRRDWNELEGSAKKVIGFKIGVHSIRIVGLREAGLSYRAVAARVQRNSSTIMRVSKQWTDSSKSVSGPPKCDVSSRRQTPGFLSRKTIAACGYTGPMCIGAGALNGSRSSFLTNPASSCGTMMAEFVSGACR
ncbi:hypothetical protein TNCV_2155381 [Trichonephila clavipes]|nr:hypothetical protein TNCV_2155381 [Trichonephila clavipes]